MTNYMRLEPNPYNHGTSKLKLMSYTVSAIKFKSTILPSNIFHYVNPGFNMMSALLVRCDFNPSSYPLIISYSRSSAFNSS